MKPVQYNQKFFNGRPKNYAYLIVDPVKGGRKTVGKIRGITLNYTASQLVNFDVIKNDSNDETYIVTVHAGKKSSKRRRMGDYIE